MDDNQIEMLFKRIEIAVVVKQLVLFVDAECSCDAIDRAANCNTAFAQHPVIARGVYYRSRPPVSRITN